MTNAMLTFRNAEISDSPQIATLVNSAYRGESSRAGWTTEAELLDGVRTQPDGVDVLIQTPYSLILLGLMGDEIIASMHLQLVSEAAFLGMFAVKPTGQAVGVGKAMMSQAEIVVQQQWHAKKILMDVISVRHELIAFYERRGYARTGKISDFPVSRDLWMPKAGDLKLARMEKVLSSTGTSVQQSLRGI